MSCDVLKMCAETQDEFHIELVCILSLLRRKIYKARLALIKIHNIMLIIVYIGPFNLTRFLRKTEYKNIKIDTRKIKDQGSER